MYDEMIGHRVVVRRRLPQHKFTDVLGQLVASANSLLVRRSNGELIEIPLDEVHRIKVVPPRPPARVDALRLEEIAAAGWPAPVSEPYGDWLLRAADGWTRRANSVLPLGEPPEPVPVAIAHVEGWYAARSLPVRFQVPLTGRDELDAELARRGYVSEAPVHVQVASLDTVLSHTTSQDDLPPVALATTPDADWLAAYHRAERSGASKHYRGGQRPPPIAVTVMTAARQPIFATLRIDDDVVAIARAVVDEGWLGVTAVEVAESFRRRGIAVHVLRSLVDWGTSVGAHSTYLQVETTNTAARGLYERLGYTTHHDYHYRLRKAP